jgi:hypothetical protein
MNQTDGSRVSLSRRAGERAGEGIGLETKAGCGAAAVRGSRLAFGAPHHDVRY